MLPLHVFMSVFFMMILCVWNTSHICRCNRHLRRATPMSLMLFPLYFIMMLACICVINSSSKSVAWNLLFFEPHSEKYWCIFSLKTICWQINQNKSSIGTHLLKFMMLSRTVCGQAENWCDNRHELLECDRYLIFSSIWMIPFDVFCITFCEKYQYVSRQLLECQM